MAAIAHATRVTGLMVRRYVKKADGRESVDKLLGCYER
jgi:hypothetical protein